MKKRMITGLLFLTFLTLFTVCSCHQTDERAGAVNVDVTRGTLDFSSFTAPGLEGGVYSGTIFLDENGVILGEPVYGNKDYDGWKKLIDASLTALNVSE